VTIPAKAQRLRVQVFGAVVLICIQAGVGMFVNFFVSIPRHHSGANPSEYFSGSARSVIWAITHGAVALALHMVLGLLLGIMVIGIVARAVSLGRTSVTTWTALGAMGTIGAGFTGAGFLDFNEDVSSFFMTVLALASLLCFVVVLLLEWESAPAPIAAQAPSDSSTD
jgi:hypothetical protein